MNLRYVFWGIALVVCMTLSTPALAAGLWMYEKGTPDVGTANAGAGARTEDASTALNNPAGMTRLDKPQLLIGQGC